jgi:cell division protein FtsQ
MADDVDLWEHLRHDDTEPMSVDPDDQSVDALLAELEAFANEPADPGDPEAVTDPEPAPERGAGSAPRSRAGSPHRRRTWLRRRRPAPEAEVADVVEEPEPEPEEPPVPAPEAHDAGDMAPVISIGRKAEDDDTEADTGDDSAAVAVVHDRMRARRIAVRREEGLRRLHRLAWGLGVVTALVVAAALGQTPLFDVDRIEIHDAGGQVTPSSIRWASGVHQGDALLTMDEHGAERAIEALPWVAEADVRREWPNTVRISVTERTPAAVLFSGPGLPRAAVDAAGRVLQIGDPLPPGLVTITGMPATLREGEQLPAVGRDALELALAASIQVPGAVRSVTPGLEAELAAGGVARFGSLDQLDEKLQSLATVLARVDMTCADVLDVKVPGTATVSRRSC